MAIELEIRERQKNHLLSLLNIKAANEGNEVKGLQDELKRAIAPMEQEDIAWVEKLAGVKVF
jgi:hypothetical protein